MNLAVKGQNPCGDKAENWNLEIGNTNLPITYYVQSDSITTINNILIKANSITGATNVRMVNNIIFFEVKNHKIDLRPFGLGRGQTSIFALHPMNFNVSIQYIKGGYLVKVSGIVSLVPSISNPFQIFNYTWNSDLYKKDGCLKSLGYKAVIKTLIASNGYFKQLFLI